MCSAPRLKKRYGQHHLRHAGLCAPLIAFLRPAGRRVLEVGAGGGVLSGALLEAGAAVWAWEIDPEWAFRLRGRLGGRLAVVAGDAAELDWARLPAGTLVAGNLPYGIATRLVQDLLARAPAVRRCAFLVQLEVARRLVAAAGDSEYGALSVLVQARAEVRFLGRVRRRSFRPAPKVDGAFVGLRRREPAVAEPWSGFETLVRLAFSRRRKTLRNALAARWGRGPAEELLATRKLPASARAVELGVEEFLRLTREARRLGLVA